MLPTLIISAILLQGTVADLPLDTMVDVGGHRLHFRIHRGSIPITIVMESGGGATLERWGGVDTELARRTKATVVAYERAGFGGSELGPLELAPTTQVRQLGAALERLDTPPRRIVIGHSYGGLMAVVHADFYRDQVV
ncbi:MAG TPA: alpha/beta hydrolase, partial [Longimicrobiales bacterium]|nr:alpha/beta hydrolase [Longimicrobiales bacterium]